MNFIITNREIFSNNGTESIREDGREHAGDNLRFGTYDLTARRFHIFPEPIKADETVYGNVADKNPDLLKGSAKFFRVMYDQLINENVEVTPKGKQKGDVLFFIHGFNTDLAGVRDAFDRLNKKYVQDKHSPINHIVIFTWPGMHPLLPYHYFDDAKDAERSGEAFARAIEKTHAFMREFLVRAENKRCGRNINLMVHSMGHRVLKTAMFKLQNKLELFHEIFLMAADIEYNIFDHSKEYYNLIDLGSRIHIYHHNNDHVLDISKYTKNFGNRLGRYGRRSVDPTLQYIYDVDASKTSDDGDQPWLEKEGNHWYYYSSHKVVDDIINILNGGDSLIK